MKIQFPHDFFFGTSTAAYQIETAFEHDWVGVKSRDGFVFDRTSDHEKNFKQDAEIIAHCSPHYRMSLMWSKLQRSPKAEFHQETVREYRSFLDDLKQRGVKIMMVLHHFTNPDWFSSNGNWMEEKNIELFVDFGKKLVDEFGEYVTSWNTFNEPNVYASNAFVMGDFPPFKKNFFSARKAIINMGKAHNLMYDYIKAKYPNQPIGISHNTVVFGANNILGLIPAKISDWWFMDYCLSQFTTKLDFFGMSYYCRIGYDPLPVSYIDTPEKIIASGKPHDEMWEYYPQGFAECIERYWKKFKLPIVITENGICTNDDNVRISVMKDYIKILKSCIEKGVDVKGYYWWSTFDNFEWNLGPTFRFGLYDTDVHTKVKTKRPSADVYRALAYSNSIEL
jgi:beta-glucosidase